MKSRKKIFAIASVLIAASLAAWGFLIEPDRLVVNNYELKLKRWSSALNNFKIVVISDLHAGSNFITKEKLRRIVAETNSQNPDLVVLLGDYVSPSFSDPQELNMPVRTVAENLRGFQAKYGVYAVLGNREWAYNDPVVRDELKKNGFNVLENETATLNVNGEKLRILGLKDQMHLGDWRAFTNEIRTKLAENDSTGNIIVLTHSPDMFPVVAEESFIANDTSLFLAGHTHGGQCRFPFIGAPFVPSLYGQKYAAGHVREQGTDMFVTTGIGTSMIPVRFGVPPEISVLTIYKE